MDLSTPAARSLLADFDNAYADLLRQLVRRTGNLDDARDLVHDTWLRLAEHAGSDGSASEGACKPLRSPRAYLSTMAQNLALDHLRRGRQRISYLEQASADAVMAPSFAPDVADTVMYRQAVDVISQCLAGLPARSQAIFLAHRLHGEKQADIASRLRLSLNTVERDLMQTAAVIEDALHRWRGEPARSARHGRRRGLSTLLGMAGVITLGCMLGRRFIEGRSEEILWQVSLSNGRGRRTTHALPDGSELQLDAASQIAIVFRAGRRTARLQNGAAFFSVAHDAQRPFTVTAGAATVTVLGTRFGVEVSPDEAVLVQVESGRVCVAGTQGSASPSAVLHAGQSLRVPRSGDWPAPRDEPLPAPWRHGELVFDGRPLGEVIARLDRYAPFQLTASPQAAALTVSGHLRIARAAEWLAALPRSLPVQVRRDASGAMHIAAR